MRDSADGRRHLIIGSNEISYDEMMGTYYNRYGRGEDIYSPTAGLYGTLMNQFRSFDGGLYLGSLQLNSKAGDLSANRYGFRTAVFMEIGQGIFGGASAVLHLDKSSRFNLIEDYSQFIYKDTTFKGWLDREHQRFFDADLSVVASIFPFGRSSDESKMILLDFYESRKVDSLSDSMTIVHGYTRGTGDTIKHYLFRIPLINEYFFNNNNGNAGISFLWMKTGNSFFKIRAAASYTRLCKDTLYDSIFYNHSYDENNNDIYTIDGWNAGRREARMDTSGARLGVTERFICMRKPFTFIAGFDGLISVKLFRKGSDRRFGGNIEYYFDNCSLREYKLAIPLSVRWERGNFALDWSCYPAMIRTHLIDHREETLSSEWSIEQASLACTFTFKKLRTAFIPVLRDGILRFNKAELMYTGGRE